jgi:23S rRNA (guanosine2251-2'-O)-methyltransferase
VSSSHERNDRKRGPAQRIAHPSKGARQPFRSKPESGGAEWLWGWHAVAAALSNPTRAPAKRILASAERARQLTQRFGPLAGLETTEGAYISQQLPAGAVHQGVAMKGPLLEPTPLEGLAARAQGILLMLDQLTDPQNVGAIFRSAAAFGAQGVILQDRHAPPLSGALAKAAAGAVDIIPHARAVNLSRALETLTELGWRAVGLDGGADDTLEAVLDDRPTVLVLGSEGEGLRRLVAEHCDVLARIPMPGGFESLNVSAAAAVALYAATNAHKA